MPLLSRLKKRSTAIYTLTACMLMAGGLATSPAFANSHTPPDHRVTICHATGSATNPYVVITPAKAAVINGHGGDWHQDARDIIPPFEGFAGLNWDAEGQAIFNAGCQVVKDTPPTTQPPKEHTPKDKPPAVHEHHSPVPSGAAAGRPGGAAQGNLPLGAARPAPAQSVTISADTAAAAGGEDYTVSAALLGSGLLLLAWTVLSWRARRPRGQHA